MPTVLRTGAYRFFFYAGDWNEPPHIHIERDGDMAKFWLKPIRLQSSSGFNRPEITKLTTLVTERQDELLRAWNAYFKN
ncbi:MAG: DUF4160 domain-containing protein [Burkholderiales bacterium]